MKIIYSLCLLTFTFLPFLGAQTTISVADHGALPNDGGAYGAARAGDDTLAFKNALVAAKAVGGAVTLLVPPGVYDFYTNDATTRPCFTSNSTENSSNGNQTISIDIVDIDDLTISATGVTFMMRGKMTMLVAEQCENLIIQGATFDFLRPTMSEFTITEKGSNYYIAEVHQDSDYQINGSSITWVGEGWTLSHNAVQHYNHATGETWRASDPTSGASSIQDLGNRRLQFNFSSAPSSAVVGRTYQLRNTTRNNVGMWFNHCKDVLMTDVKVRAMHGFGILGQFTENITYERLEVIPDPASGRTNASAADITHFSSCKGLVRITDSILTASHDDAMNVHGTHLRVTGQPAANQVRVRFIHHQTRGFQAFFVGDTIEYISQDTMLPLGSATVTAVVVENERDQLLTLDQNVPASVVNNKDAVENVTWTPSVEMINCTMSQIPTRGILLTTRKPILIQGNRFIRTQMPAILIEDDAKGWFESGRVLDLTVRGNVFYESGDSNVIKINPENSVHGGSVHENLLFEDNEFVMDGNNAFHIKSTGNVTIQNNHVRNRNGGTSTLQSLTWQQNTTNVTFSGNTSESATTPAVTESNGNMESQAVAAGATVAGVQSWIISTGVLTQGSGLTQSDAGTSPYTASNTAFIPADQFIAQRLGYYDPLQGAFLPWSLRQTKRVSPAVGSGGLKVTFYQGNGVYDGSGNADPKAAGLTQIGNEVILSELGSQRDSRLARGNLSFTGLEAGTEIWMRIEALGQIATLDDVSLAPASAAYSPSFTAWMNEQGLPLGSRGLSSDADGDGTPLQIEYAVSGDPLFQDVPPAWTSSSSGFIHKPVVNPSFTVQAKYQIGALDANGWEDLTPQTPGFAYTTDSSGNSIFTLTMNHERVFYRLEASSQASVSINNGSSEFPDRTGLNPAHTSSAPAGWEFVASINGGVEEIRDNRFGTIGSEGSRLDTLGGDGDQVSYLNLGFGTSSSGSAISDVLEAVEPDTIYRVTVAMGRRVSGDDSPDGSLGFSVNGTDLSGFTVVDSSAQAKGTFQDYTFEWTSPAAGDPMIGEDLRVVIRFTYATDLTGWQQGQFDHVRVEKEQAP